MLLDGIVAGGLAAREQAGPAQPTSLAGTARAQKRATPEYFADRVFPGQGKNNGLYAGPPALDGENSPQDKSKTLPRLRAPSPLAQQPNPPRQQPQAIAPTRDTDTIAGAEGNDRLLGGGPIPPKGLDNHEIQFRKKLYEDISNINLGTEQNREFREHKYIPRLIDTALAYGFSHKRVNAIAHSSYFEGTPTAQDLLPPNLKRPDGSTNAGIVQPTYKDFLKAHPELNLPKLARNLTGPQLMLVHDTLLNDIMRTVPGKANALEKIQNQDTMPSMTRCFPRAGVGGRGRSNVPTIRHWH